MSLSPEPRGRLEPLLDVPAVAEILRVPITAVYVLAERGQLAHYKIGRRIRFRLADVELLLSGGHVPAERTP